MQDIREIDIETELGKYLLMAISKITSESQTDKTPNEVLAQLSELKEKVFIDAETYGSKGSDEIKGIGSKDINGNEMVFDQELFNYFSQEFNINLLGTEMHDIIDIVKRHTSSQTEISDEEIEKEANNLFAGDLMWSERIAFKVAIKWYREQLKKKQ